MTTIRSIIGLGNPGEAYRKTRHNFGFLVIDFLVKRWKLKLKENKFLNAKIVVVHPALACKSGVHPALAPPLHAGAGLACKSGVHPELTKYPHQLILAKPLTYMNYSGKAVSKLIRKYKLNPEEILIVYDDFNLPFGTIRIRQSGSSGGHQGLKSIADSLNTEKFSRLRVGCGPLPSGINPVDFVLSRFSQEEENKLEFLLRKIGEAIDTIHNKGLEKAMSVYNRKSALTNKK